jgi:L-cystine uptake protein TcyP (sodium:dicarboxylate symporter family)
MLPVLRRPRRAGLRHRLSLEFLARNLLLVSALDTWIDGERSMATITTTAPVARKPLYTSLFVQVLFALLLGIVLGMAVPDFAISLKIFSDAFLKLISMIVAPIVFCVVVHGIAGAGDLKKVGRVGVKALIYFEVMTTVALVVTVVVAAWEGDLDRDKAQQVLNGDELVDVTAG